MITEGEIQRVADLMRIEIVDNAEYVKKVQEMLEYFDTLDEISGADKSTHKDLEVNEKPLEELREDRHIAYPDSMMDSIKNRDRFVRAPRMK